MKAVFDRSRQALDFLEAHRLEPTSINIDVVRAYIADPGSALARDIDALTDGGLRLSPVQIADLAERHLRRHDDGAARVLRQTDRLDRLTGDVHGLASQLGEEVGAVATNPAPWPDIVRLLTDRLGDAERQLADLRDEISLLRGEIASPPREDARRDVPFHRIEPVDAADRIATLVAGQRGYAIVVFGLDDLLGINTRFGRDVGDNVINALASTLRQTFAERPLLRSGGNEFVIVLVDTVQTVARAMTDDALAAFAARRLKLRGDGSWIGQVTASAGIGIAKGDPSDAVLGRARTRMLEATADGGNRVIG